MRQSVFSGIQMWQQLNSSWPTVASVDDSGDRSGCMARVPGAESTTRPGPGTSSWYWLQTPSAWAGPYAPSSCPASVGIRLTPQILEAERRGLEAAFQPNNVNNNDPASNGQGIAKATASELTAGPNESKSPPQFERLSDHVPTVSEAV